MAVYLKWGAHDSRNFNLAFLLFGLALAKGALLLALGPVHAPDSIGYVRYAEAILNGHEWLSVVDIEKNFYQPLTAFRMIGYPALIAFIKLISPTYWDWLLVAFQFALSLLSTAIVYHLAIRISKSGKLALFSALAHGVGQTIAMDQCILTDSLNASLLVIVAGHIGIRILDRHPPSIVEAAVLGFVVFVAFLFREAGSILQYIYWPMIAYWVFVSQANRIRSIMILVAFAMPVFLGVQSYKGWNEARTGERFITTSAQTALFLPTIRVEEKGTSLVEKDELLKDMGELAPLKSEHLMENVYRINKHLALDHGLNAVEIMNFGYTHFFRSWSNNAGIMARYTLSQFREKQAFLAFMPAESLSQLVYWSGRERLFPAKGQLWQNVKEDLRIDQLIMVVVRGLSRVFSILVSIAFLIGVPVAFLKQVTKNRAGLSNYDPPRVLAFLYWLAYFGYTLTYAMVSLEMRYLMPVEPFSMIIGITLLISWARKVLHRRRVPA